MTATKAAGAFELALLPVELDPSYVQPEESVADAVIAKRPEVGGWILCFHPLPNGAGVRRAVEHPLMARVEALRDGDYQHGGCEVLIWSREVVSFVERIFVPWCCISARTYADHYSLTGNWPASWPVPA